MSRSYKKTPVVGNAVARASDVAAWKKASRKAVRRAVRVALACGRPLPVKAEVVDPWGPCDGYHYSGNPKACRK